MICRCESVWYHMHMIMWIMYPSKAADPRILMEKRFVVRIPYLPLAFTVRIISQKIYISIICSIRMVSEWHLKELLLSECPVLSDGHRSYASPPHLGLTLTGALLTAVADVRKGKQVSHANLSIRQSSFLCAFTLVTGWPKKKFRILNLMF